MRMRGHPNPRHFQQHPRSSRQNRCLEEQACSCCCVCEFYHLMRLDKQTCDWHNKKCDSLYVTQDISKEACQAAGNAVALIRVKINPIATNNVVSRIVQCKKWLQVFDTSFTQSH